MEVFIIGNGPAGISAALYTVRAGIKTTVIGKDNGALGKAEKIENYYGFPVPVTGQALADNGITQAKRLGVEFITDEVVGLGLEEDFTIETPGAVYHADSVILATGSSRTTPGIEGFAAYEGKGISYCAVCDAFFYRGKDVAVLGSGQYALHEAAELLPVVKSVTVLTNGQAATVPFPPEVIVETGKIAELTGETVLDGAVFEDGVKRAFSGLFVALGVAGSTDLAKKIGAQVNGDNITADVAMQTSVPGLFAAGDCTGGMKQIAKAVYEGAAAGSEAVKYLRKLSKESKTLA